MILKPHCRLMNPPAKKNEAYQPTVIEQTANIITHGVGITTYISLLSVKETVVM